MLNVAIFSALPGAAPREAGGWPGEDAGRCRGPRSVQPASETVQIPVARQRGRYVPGRASGRAAREAAPWRPSWRSAGRAQRIGLLGEAPVGQRLLQRAVAAQQGRRAFRADAARAGQPVRRIAAQGDEVGHLPGLDAIALAHFGRADARHFAGLERVQNGRRVGGELERIAVAAGDEDCAATAFLSATAAARKSSAS